MKTKLTSNLDIDCKRPLAIHNHVLQCQIKQDRLQLAENQHELETEKLLEEIQVRVVWHDHSDGDLKSPNAEDDCSSDERHKEHHDVVDCIWTLDRDQIQGQKDDDMDNGHLKDEEAKNSELWPAKVNKKNLNFVR